MFSVRVRVRVRTDVVLLNVRGKQNPCQITDFIKIISQS